MCLFGVRVLWSSSLRPIFPPPPPSPLPRLPSSPCPHFSFAIIYECPSIRLFVRICAYVLCVRRCADMSPTPHTPHLPPTYADADIPTPKTPLLSCGPTVVAVITIAHFLYHYLPLPPISYPPTSPHTARSIRDSEQDPDLSSIAPLYLYLRLFLDHPDAPVRGSCTPTLLNPCYDLSTLLVLVPYAYPLPHASTPLPPPPYFPISSCPSYSYLLFLFLFLSPSSILYPRSSIPLVQCGKVRRSRPCTCIFTAPRYHPPIDSHGCDDPAPSIFAPVFPP